VPIAWLLVIGLAGGAIAGAAAFKFLSNIEPRSSTVAPVSASADFRLCGPSLERNCVIDGDTLRYEGVKIRLADIDTPEISSPKCASELELGQRAKHRLLELMNAGSFSIVHTGSRDEDVYGRKLRVITRNGRSVGETLIAEGLARRWDGARRSWC
jgi:endonuclease YncB( thermonuclease family)